MRENNFTIFSAREVSSSATVRFENPPILELEYSFFKDLKGNLKLDEILEIFYVRRPYEKREVKITLRTLYFLKANDIEIMGKLTKICEIHSNSNFFMVVFFGSKNLPAHKPTYLRERDI